MKCICIPFILIFQCEDETKGCPCDLVTCVWSLIQKRSQEEDSDDEEVIQMRDKTEKLLSKQFDGILQRHSRYVNVNK